MSSTGNPEGHSRMPLARFPQLGGQACAISPKQPQNHLIRHIASTAELWFMRPGSSGCDASLKQEFARCGPRRSRTPKSHLYAELRVQVGPCAAAIQGAETTMPVFFRTIAIAALAAALLMPEGSALAGLGQPTPWQIGLQDSASPVMDDVVWFHTFVFWIITAITIFVLALLVVVIVKFNADANPTPSRTTHNTLGEVLLTVIPR